MNKKTRVGIVFGGRSAEHEVSLQSARNLIEALDPARFEAVLIGVDKQGQWRLCDRASYLAQADDPSRIALNCAGPALSLCPGQAGTLCDSSGARVAEVDVVFPIVHGTQGEDGCLQGVLRMLGVPFVGSDVLGSAICMDKDVSKRLLREAGIAVTPFLCVQAGRGTPPSFTEVQAQLGLPVFVKPANMGSSVGVSRASDAPGYQAALTAALRYDSKVLIEAAVEGREIECAVLGNATPHASGCGEVAAAGGFYSYDSKYISAGAAQVLVPAAISEAHAERIRQVAIKAFQVLECTGLARVDVFLTAGGEVLVNELNTLPGFTGISMYPKLWLAAGLSYRELVSQLLDLALEHHHQRQALQSTR